MKKILATMLAFLLSGLPMVLADDVTVTGDVDKAMAVTFNYNSVAFGSLTQGTSENAPSTACSTGVYNATVDTNYAWQVSVNGTDFDDGGGHNFDKGNLDVDTNSSKDNLSPTTAVTGSPAVVGSYSSTGTAIDDFHCYDLDVPAYQYSASYSATVTWTYANQ